MRSDFERNFHSLLVLIVIVFPRELIEIFEKSFDGRGKPLFVDD